MIHCFAPMPRPVARSLVMSIVFVLAAFAGLSNAHAQNPASLTSQQLEERVVALFARSCAQVGCHAAPIPQQEMDLSAEQFYASIVGVPSKGRPDVLRIHPGHPESSYLIKKVRGDSDIEGVQMPLVGDRLTEEEIQTIEAWISGLNAVDEARVQAAPPPEPFPFAGWQVVNTPTTRMVPAGNLLFRISHRFNPPLSSGYDSFWGLDGSGIILMSLGYSFTDNFFVTLGRSNAEDDVELQARYLLAQQGKLPFDLALQTTFNWISEDVPDVGRYSNAAFKFTGQAVLAREISPGIGATLAPGLTINPSHETNADDVLLTLGVGGRIRLHGNVSLVAEWIPILSGYVRTTTLGNENRFDSWGTGLEIATSGHVFQIVLSNAAGVATDQYLNGGDLDIRDADLRLGFNIYRIINL